MIMMMITIISSYLVVRVMTQSHCHLWVTQWYWLTNWHSASDADERQPEREREQRERQQRQPERERQQEQCDQLSADKCPVADADKTTADGDEQHDEVSDVDDDEEKIPDWIRCSPADLYFKRDSVLIHSYNCC